MPKIRPARRSDLERVRHICIETADERLKSTPEKARITALLFADYYILHESHNCFVLEDEGEVVGYILCCTDVKKMCRHYTGDIFKQVASLSPLWGVACLFIPVKYVLYQKKYPAHLHIDILEGWQSSGYGSKLMEQLLAHLKSQGVRGVCLSCGAKNIKAVNFYTKYGFERILCAFGGLLMGRRI